MPRQRRRIEAHSCYEICFRAKEGLPLVAYRVIRFLLGAILARTQRDDKVTLCHDIWNGSHCHMIVVARDAEQFVCFYSEVQKKITDAIKRLLGISHLNIWEGRPLVAKIQDLEAAKGRIAYLYGNAAQDNLTESIDRFPRYSSWRNFSRCKNSFKAETREKYPWVRLWSIPTLSSPILTARQDSNLVRLLRKRNSSKTHCLVREPNAWMCCFGIDSDEEVYKINRQILRLLRDKEAAAAEKRQSERKTVMGIFKLCSQPIMAPHTPKKRERQVFVITSIRELRVRAIENFRQFCVECRECFLRWKSGDFTAIWPPGAFKPPLPPNANLLAL